MIETERLILRPWLESDAVALYKYARDPSVGPEAGWSPHTSVENSLEIIRTVFAAPETYAVALKETGEAVGCCGIMMSGGDRGDGTGVNGAEIGYWIGRPYWGRGLMTEAVRALLSRCFVELGLDAVWCAHYDGNDRSRRVIKKCGFRPVHTERDTPTPPGDRRAERFYIMTREDYAARMVYPRSGDRQTVYLKAVVTRPSIEVGEYTVYNDFVNDPRDFEKNNVLYQYPVNHDRLVIGRYCSIACGAKFIFNSANHTLRSLSTYTFPLFYEAWGLRKSDMATAWDNRGDIVVGNDVWIGYGAIVMSGVTIGDGAVIGAGAVVTGDVEPYSIVGGVPAREIRRRFAPELIERLMEIRWWERPADRVRAAIPAIQSGDIETLEEILTTRE